LALKQKAEELARQKADALARQQAEELARQKAAELARQQAEQTAAASQRQRDQAAADALSAGAGTNAAGAGGAGVTVAKNMLGSDVGNRVRELTRGIDLLSGAPPQRPRGDDERSGRRVVVGSAEHDVPLRMYVDSFRQKIERNGGLAFAPTAADRLRDDPLVSVAIRSDGSVEEVTIVRSSGHADTDNAVRHIVRLNARYSSFPPNIASRYDVIEIRRIWSFADTLKLMEELY
jgi:TonB family protein